MHSHSPISLVSLGAVMDPWRVWSHRSLRCENDVLRSFVGVNRRESERKTVVPRGNCSLIATHGIRCHENVKAAKARKVIPQVFHGCWRAGRCGFEARQGPAPPPAFRHTPLPSRNGERAGVNRLLGASNVVHNGLNFGEKAVVSGGRLSSAFSHGTDAAATSGVRRTDPSCEVDDGSSIDTHPFPFHAGPGGRAEHLGRLHRQRVRRVDDTSRPDHESRQRQRRDRPSAIP